MRTNGRVPTKQTSELIKMDIKNTELLDMALLTLDDCKLDCDGMTYVISHLLTEAGIPHRMMVGAAYDPISNDSIYPHCWVELSENQWIIDYRLRRWLGDSDLVPHGIFKPETVGMVYRGDTLKRAQLHKNTLMMMTDQRIAEVCLVGMF